MLMMKTTENKEYFLTKEPEPSTNLFVSNQKPYKHTKKSFEKAEKGLSLKKEDKPKHLKMRHNLFFWQKLFIQKAVAVPIFQEQKLVFLNQLQSQLFIQKEVVKYLPMKHNMLPRYDQPKKTNLEAYLLFFHSLFTFSAFLTLQLYLWLL